MDEQAALIRTRPDDEWDPPSDCCPTDHFDGKKLAAEIDQRARALFRLLTWQDMELAWRALSRPCVSPSISRLEVDGTDMAPYLLWDYIDRALDEFERLSLHRQSAAGKRKRLVSIAKKTEELLAAIRCDPTASSVALGLMECHMHAKNLEFRQTMGDTPSKAEFTMPLTLSGDCHEARTQIGAAFLDDEFEDEGENWKWGDQPLVYRLEYWASLMQETGLGDLLGDFAATIKAEADVPPVITQPGRGEHAIRPFLLRRVSEFIYYLYGQPLDEAVARIVTAVLDLNVPLTRDDVRPYTRQTGKKMADHD
ncbi:MAG: hypothetical protein KF710_00010 [Rhodocyclaceae bacterium]|nr:hypothetical protein [Rhodocyclaceae bacterium]